MRNGIEPWPGRAVHPQAAPGDALLPDRDADRRRLRRAVVEPAALGQQVVAADRVRVVLGHPAGAVGAAGLLVGDGEVEQVAPRAAPARDEVLEGDGHRRRQVEHVDGAAAPDLGDAVAVRDELAAERVAVQPSGCTGTTSVWPIRHRLGAPGSEPSMRATNDARPGVGSQRSIVTPGPST